MKRFFFILGIAAILVGCDNSEIFLEVINDKPSIYIIDQNDTTQRHDLWTDSAKVSSEVGLFSYEFQLEIDDFNSNLDQVEILDDIIDRKDTLNGFLLFQYDTMLIDIEVVSIDVKNQLIDIQVVPFDESYITLTFIVFDDFMESDTATLELEIYDNLPPVVQYEIRESQVSGDFIRLIDLSNSFDRDEKYGGAIRSYHFISEHPDHSFNLMLSSESREIVFPDQGTYFIEVFVTDNNGAQSTVETIELNIND